MFNIRRDSVKPPPSVADRQLDSKTQKVPSLSPDQGNLVRKDDTAIAIKQPLAL